MKKIDNNYKKDENNINIINDYYIKEKKKEVNENINNNENKNINAIIDEDNKMDNNNKNKKNKNKENINDEKDNEFRLFVYNLEKYFFYDDSGNLIKRNPKNNVLNEFENFLIDKNIQIKKIKEYLENYIQYAVRPEMEKLNDYDKKQVNNRIYRIRNKINNLKINNHKKNIF